VAESVTVVNVLGGADLDLSEATLAAREVTIRVLSILGGSDITVPDDVQVELSSFALLGGDELKLERPEPPPGAPVVRVHAWSLLGGTDVRTKGTSLRGGDRHERRDHERRDDAGEAPCARAPQERERREEDEDESRRELVQRERRDLEDEEEGEERGDEEDDARGASASSEEDEGDEGEEGGGESGNRRHVSMMNDQ
jgi:hypothetical protein